MKRILLAIIALLLWAGRAAGATYTPSDVPNVHVADRTKFVADPDGILSETARAQLDTLMARMRSRLTVEPMVVVVGDITDPDNEHEFATRLFEQWGIGKADKDNGLLVLMVENQHAVVVRTGYGLEGVLPDIVCGRIIRNVFIPAAKEGDYDKAMLQTMATINEILSDPAVADEYRSDDADSDSNPMSDKAFRIYIFTACAVALAMLLLFLYCLYRVRTRSDYQKYRALERLRSPYLALTAAGIFIPLIASVPLILCLNRWRNRPRICPSCGAKMIKVDEVHDNDYLTPAQDLEERIGSVDYDVWLCRDCGETDILAYTLPSSTYTECPECGARTMRPTGYRVVVRPTATNHGTAVRDYECLNCHHRKHDKIDLPPDAGSSVAGAAAAGAILGGMGRGGGGFSGPVGGGFGGGMTGGGGAGGRW